MKVRVVHVYRNVHGIVAECTHAFILDEGRNFYSIYMGHVSQQYVERDFYKADLDPLTWRYR